MEDPWNEPPDDAFAWAKSLSKSPATPEYVEIGFEQGIPVNINGKRLAGIDLIDKLNVMAGNHGIGRIDHVESRVVGIKSREVYEAPAAIVLIKAHKALESMTLSREQLRFKEKVSVDYADLVYNGMWFTAFRQDLAAFVTSTQRYVTGTVRMKLFKGNCMIVGRKSPYSLYRHNLATYEKGDMFDQSASVGFIKLFGLPVRVQTEVQLAAKPPAKRGRPPKKNK